jgi:plasmid maintenance system antidote protein VapI
VKRTALPDELREGIRQSGKNVYQLAKASGVSHPVILRFLSGERDIRLETAGKLAATLGMRLESMRK